MFKYVTLVAVLGMCFESAVFAQPDPPRERGGRRGIAGGDLVATAVNRLLSLDSDRDGQVSWAEVADLRLRPLFTRADADSNGVLTRDELTASFTRDAEALGAANRRGPGGPPGFGPDRPDAPGPGGPRPPGGQGRLGPGPDGGPPQGPPRPGLILPPFVVEMLELTDSQRDALNALQKEVDERLAKILTDEQRQRLSEQGHRRPGPPPGDRPGRPNPDSDRPPLPLRDLPQRPQ